MQNERGRRPFPVSSVRIAAISSSASRAWMTSGSCVIARGRDVADGSPHAAPRAASCRSDSRVPASPIATTIGSAAMRDKLVGGHVRLLGGVVRMRADRAVDALVALDASPSAPRNARTRVEMRDHRADAGRPRARDDRVAIGVEVGKVEMAVAVDEHRGRKPKTSGGDRLLPGRQMAASQTAGDRLSTASGTMLRCPGATKLAKVARVQPCPIPLFC